MNTARDLLKRLLFLYPAKNVKDSFDLTGHITDVVEEVSAKSPQIIKQFVYDNHRFTKQHIHIYRFNKIFVEPANYDDFPYRVEIVNNVDGVTHLFCIPTVRHFVFLSNPLDREFIDFYQPVLISIKNKDLIIRYTKLEKNISVNWPDARNAKNAETKQSETETLAKILAYFTTNYTVTANDLNKGIKALWESDDLDCTKIAWMDSFSSDNSVMHGNMTYKQKYPDRYELIKLTPIGKTVWKYLLADDYLCNDFAADINLGKINITKFPKNGDQIDNVINKILTKNR